MSNSFKSKKYRVPVAKPIPRTRPKRAYSLPLAWSRRWARASAAICRVPGLNTGLKRGYLIGDLLGKAKEKSE